ncbi:surface-adhesin E family protein [Phenylobacterium sp.]|uniref:surface-adhesin E family protein n=1 Tax=Phenylobacterium sp. TaxID=1871053 RepID=UPI0025E83E3E|nr:surface-adhesin E family protein [Phenylobacterium sp.]
MMRGLGIVAALLLAAASAPAQTPAPVDPPPPASLAAKDVLAWTEAHLDADSWRVLGINPYGLFFASPQGVTLRHDRLAEADLRHELFAPVDMGGGQMRSDLEHWLVDCEGKRHAMLKMTLYARNNLKEEFAFRQTETPNWLEADPADESARAIAAICEAVKAGQRPDKPPGRPAGPSPHR